MKTLILTSIVASSAIAAQSAGAFEVTGGTLDFSYSAFTEDTDFSRTALRGSVELGFNRNFGLQLDAGAYDFDFVDETVTNLGLHGLYHVNEATSFGLFVGQEELDGESLDFYGLEFGHEMAQFEVEGYLSQVDAEGEDANGLGLMGRFAVTPQVGLSASADRLDLDGLDLTRWGLMVDYAPVDNFSLYAEIGTLDASISGASDSETFIGLGAKISFGAARGATFGDRGVFKYLPGL